MREVSRDRGMVTAFAVSIVLTLFIASGLAIDSGRLVAARIQVADHAENAARLAAQELIGIRAGSPAIDQEKGRRVALDYLADHGVTGEVSFGRRSVAVSVHTTREMTILKLAGIQSKRVSATRTAEVADA